MHYALYTSEKEFRKALVKLGITDIPNFMIGGYGATTYFRTDKDGDDLAIVTINSSKGRTLEQNFKRTVSNALRRT